jgi:hypothetical protein
LIRSPDSWTEIICRRAAPRLVRPFGLFLTLTLDSGGKVGDDGTPRNPGRYDYQQAAPQTAAAAASARL